MIIFIPLGGLGTRFKKFGYKLPKPLIKVLGKPILYWLLDSISIPPETHCIIPYNQELEKYRFEEQLQKDYPHIKFIFHKLVNNTRGASETIQQTLKIITLPDQPIICLDGDNFYTSNIINRWNGNNSVFCFEDKSSEEVYSYSEITNNKITQIKEKCKISNFANTGAYAFNSYKTLLHYATYIIENDIRDKEEFYTSTLISQMIKEDHIFTPIIIPQEEFICLGTPLHVRLFCNNFPRINANTSNNMLKPQRYCFDLDNTLVTFPKVPNDYTTVEPIQHNIDFLKYLKRLGHTIIIYTARRMKTHKGNQAKVIADIGKITLETLDKFNIEYDEIYFGKPHANCYIDDLAISSYEDLEKEFGYYQSYINPRDFNNLQSSSIQIYKKTSNDLSGEIFYYTHIPYQIKDLFPILINYDENNTSYDIEKINGIPISKLYLGEELTEKQLYHIMGSIQRIHDVSINNNDDINIYCNYATKLKNRFDKYDYSSFPNSLFTYQSLLSSLKKYENENLGKKTVIHGDTVFTNILINQFGKIKFIDMRGKQGNTLSIYGDYLYDWAKLYQSLIGYDEILEGKKINKEYKDKLINYFKKEFIKRFDEDTFKNLQTITKSLLFTLIPLHNNNKCIKYYELIFN